MTEILKDEFGFQGFLISDYVAVNKLPGNYKEQVALTINAGMDMVMVPDHYEEFFEDLKANVQEGKIPQARIDDAVILRVKCAMGMLDANRSQMADRKLWNNFGSPEHRAVARQAVRESLVLLKNDQHALPLAKSVTRIHVAGGNVDNIGNQCGDWTIKWQGESGDYKGQNCTGSHPQTCIEEHQRDVFERRLGAAGATVGVVVVGEAPTPRCWATAPTYVYPPKT